MLLELGQTTLVLLKAPQSPAQVVQLTVGTKSQLATVSELAEWHLAQAKISNALLKIAQADIDSNYTNSQNEENEERPTSRPRLPPVFVVESPRFRIHCRKAPAKYLRERWELYWGDETVQPASHKWIFEFVILSDTINHGK